MIKFDFQKFLYKHSYEILLVTLLFHLYGSIFFKDLDFYGKYVRMINTIILYSASLNVFINYKRKDRPMLLISAFFFLINFLLLFINYSETLDILRNFSYLIFLLITMVNIFKFLNAPNRFDIALISSAIAGYLLIIEVAVRMMLILSGVNPIHNLQNTDYTFHTKTFIDTVYFCTITMTSVGYGDILPKSTNVKMLTSILALVGQFYLVIIMGIMISKFLSAKNYQ